MSAPPVGVSIVDHSGDEETLIATAAFDDVPEALDAVELLMRFWAFDEGNGRRIEIQRC